jgi:choline dehydrogenase-like flavoprotein
LERPSGDLFDDFTTPPKCSYYSAKVHARTDQKPDEGRNVMSDEFDFVVVGGGSGGCAVAGRLSEDPATSVALLEAGGKDDNWVVTPPGAMILMISGKMNNWAFNTVPQPGLNGRIGYQPRGKGLGGSSAINAMVYIRGHQSDYDHWASLGNTGWSYSDVLPYFKRS